MTCCHRSVGWVLVAFISTFSGLAQAASVSLGMPEQRDSFIAALLESKDLKEAGVNLVEKQFQSEADVLDATIKGSVNVGLFPLTALDRRQFKGFQGIYSVFTRPFMFKGGDQIFETQDAALGDAVLADLRSIGIFPLSFWNRGFSKIVARSPISEPRHFERLVVAYAAKDTPAVPPALRSLGVQLRELSTGHSVSSAFNEGIAEATLVDPWSRYEDSNLKELAEVSGPLFSTDFEPIIGVLAASNDYWSTLTEKEKQAWRAAVTQASAISQAEMKSRNAIALRFSNIRAISLREKQRQDLIYSYILSEPRAADDRRVLEEALKRLQTAQKKKN